MKTHETNPGEISLRQKIGWGLAIAALGAYFGFAAIADADQMHERDNAAIANMHNNETLSTEVSLETENDD